MGIARTLEARRFLYDGVVVDLSLKYSEKPTRAECCYTGVVEGTMGLGKLYKCKTKEMSTVLRVELSLENVNFGCAVFCTREADNKGRQLAVAVFIPRLAVH